jgi:antitoxin component YwqK of YwqJK toxin-antitoxin module
MRYISSILFLLLVACTPSLSQVTDTLNLTDSKGMKQGHWIKKDSKGKVQYEGFFRNNKPVGEFKRFYSDGKLQSVLVFSEDGKSADAVFYHTNGLKSSAGKYVNQMKEGKWQFFSSSFNDYMISEEEYKNNQRHGLSVKYYPNNIPSEMVTYKNGARDGEWLQFYVNGNVFLRGNYSAGKLQGRFTVYYDDGKTQYTGQYLDDARNGDWLKYDRNGSLNSTINYKRGIPTNPDFFIKETRYLDSLEQNKGKIQDPEKTGTIW